MARCSPPGPFRALFGGTVLTIVATSSQMLGSLRVARALGESVGSVLRAAEQDEFDELGANLSAEVFQLEHEVEPADELREQDVPSSAQLHPCHLKRHASRGQDGLDRVVQPAVKHGADHIDV
jgi:hypothetical protein